MGVSGFGESFDLSEQRTQLWPKALRLRVCMCGCSVHRSSRRKVYTTNNERARRYGDVLLAVNEGKTPKGRRIRDIGYVWRVPANHCGFNRLISVNLLELELGLPSSCRPMIGCEPHGRGVLATTHYRIPEKTVEVGSNNKGGRC